MKSIAAPCLSYRVARARFVQVGAEFLAQHYPVHTVLLPNPTWANHNKIFPLAGIKDVRKYRYFKPATKGLDYEASSTFSSPSHSFTKVCLGMPSAPDVRLRSFSGSFQLGGSMLLGPGRQYSCLCYLRGRWRGDLLAEMPLLAEMSLWHCRE